MFTFPEAQKGIFTMNSTFSVYIMASRSGTLYVGITSELEIRVRQHKSRGNPRLRRQILLHKLVYYESFDNVLKAISREKQLKGWRRSKKIALIEKVNPRWEDRAEKWGAEMRFAGQSLS